MSLDANAITAVLALYQRADVVAANEMAQGALDPATVLAVFGIFRDAMRPVDPVFAEQLVPRASEDMASKISARAITAQINAETQWSAPGAEPIGEP